MYRCGTRKRVFKTTPHTSAKRRASATISYIGGRKEGISVSTPYMGKRCEGISEIWLYRIGKRERGSETAPHKGRKKNSVSVMTPYVDQTIGLVTT